jgi:two-component system, LytTR family, response regulator
MKNCIVLDDEQHCIETLTEYIENTPNLKLLKSFKNPLDAIPFIQSERIDIAFIDVQMPNLTGLQFLKLLDKNTKKVLCTAYSEYAIDGFELAVTDYLLKPISFERFLRAINRVEENTLPTKNKEELANEFIYVKADSKQKFTKINLSEILFISGYGNYQKIQTTDKQIVTNLKLKDLEVQLFPFGFIRVHKSFLVSISKIEHFDKNKITIQNHQIPIGEGFKNEVIQELGKSILN